MHELSVAREIVTIVREHTRRLNPGHVTKVNVRLGMSAGVVAGSLQLAFQALTADDTLRQAVLAIDEVPFRVRCHACATESENPDGLRICGACGKTNVEILSGTELEVSTIEMEEDDL